MAPDGLDRAIKESFVRPSGEITYLAAWYVNETDAGHVYLKLDALMRRHNLDISVKRLRILKLWYTVLLADTNHMPLIEEETRRILLTHNGTLTPLDQDILDELISRMKEHIQGVDRHNPNRSIVENHTPTPISLPPKGVIPFIIAYRDARTDRFFANAAGDVKQSHTLPTIDGISLADAARNIYSAAVGRAQKYMFSLSALALHLAVFRLPALPVNNNIWFDASENTFIVLEEPVEYRHEPVKALYLSRAYPQAEIDRAVPSSRYPYVNQAQHKIFRPFAKQWTLAVVRNDTQVVYRFTYDEAMEAWTYPPSDHTCPYNQCSRVPINLQGSERGFTLLPCQRCREDNWFFVNWLKTALLIVKRHYAITPEPEEFPTLVEEYQTVEQVTVGKGKNKRKVPQQVKRQVEYRLITFEVSRLEPEHEHQAREYAQQQGKRLNWLQLAEKSAIIYEKRAIDTSKGRLLDPAKNSRWKSYRRIDVTPYQKYVPMLSRERKTIKRVVVSDYQAKSGPQ